MQLIIPCILFSAILCTVMADDVILQKRVYASGEDGESLDPKRKRPFCNAFTGCGRKRSDESLSALVDLNSEPAVEELSRQILSEAKLWEAIQEARLEMMNRKQQGERFRIQPLPITGIRKRTSSQYLYT